MSHSEQGRFEGNRENSKLDIEAGSLKRNLDTANQELEQLNPAEIADLKLEKIEAKVDAIVAVLLALGGVSVKVGVSAMEQYIDQPGLSHNLSIALETAGLVLFATETINFLKKVSTVFGAARKLNSNKS